MSFASSPGANLNIPTILYKHKDHRRTTFRTCRTSYQFCMTMRAKEIYFGVNRYFVLGFNIKASIQGRKPQPSVLTVK